MQDWNYIWRGTFEITVEISYVKTPPSTQLESFFDVCLYDLPPSPLLTQSCPQDNKMSMLAYMEMVHTGVRGVLRKNGKPTAGTVSVSTVDHAVYSDPANGDYYRPLPEGTCAISTPAAATFEAFFPYAAAQTS